MRSETVSDWLAQTPWGTWQPQPITSDASARGYARLFGPKGETVIMMDAPPATCGSQSEFIRLSDHLRQSGLAAPDILKWDEKLGLMVLEDLGKTDFASHLKGNLRDEKRLYLAAIACLKQIQLCDAPSGLPKMTAETGVEMISLAFEWAAANTTSPSLQTQIKAELQRLLSGLEPDGTALSLRDFHAENLIWRPDEQALLQVGLLDFQDAFLAHPAYDLASLLRDARRDVSENLTQPLIAEFARIKEIPEAAMQKAFHILAVQRNLRILGIFERLEKRDGKVGYRRLRPRVCAHLRRDLAAPDLHQLRPLIREAFPFVWDGAA